MCGMSDYPLCGKGAVDSESRNFLNKRFKGRD